MVIVSVMDAGNEGVLRMEDVVGREEESAEEEEEEPAEEEEDEDDKEEDDDELPPLPPADGRRFCGYHTPLEAPCQPQGLC